jgi:hypothetical protein
MKKLLMLILSAFMLTALVWGGGKKDRTGGFSPIDDIPPAADGLSLEEAIEQSAREIAEEHWWETVVNGNTTTYTDSSGRLDKQGYDIFITYETGA